MESLSYLQSVELFLGFFLNIQVQIYVLSTMIGNCPMIHIPGFTFPVVEYLLEDIIEKTR